MTKANGRGLNWRWEPPKQRFLRFIDQTAGADACWPWTGSKARNGYGQFGLSKSERHVMAHRYAWILFCGKIPKGLCVCHYCDNRACVNPAHLFVGTQQDNIRDCVRKQRHGTKTHPAIFARTGWRQLTVDQVKAIRADSRSERALAAEFGVSANCIGSIKRRRTWRFIP
jgi:hypothetical protein